MITESPVLANTRSDARAGEDLAAAILAEVAGADLGFVVTDGWDRIVVCGRAAQAYLGIVAGGPRPLADCVVAHHPRHAILGSELEPSDLPSSRALMGESVERVDIVLAGDPDRWVRVSAKPRRDASGRVCGAVSIWEDVTHEHQPMLGIPSMRSFGSVLFDVESRVLECSPSAGEILGMHPTAALGLRLSDFCELSVGRTMLALDDAPARTAIRTQQPHDAGVLVVTRRDDTIRWVRVEAVPLFAPAAVSPTAQGRGEVHRVLVTLTDVTAWHHVEGALRDERRRLARAGDRFRHVLESIPDAIAVYHENRFGYGNAALISMFGYESAAELVGREVTKVLPGHTPLASDVAGVSTQLREESWRLANGNVAVVEIATHALDLDGEEATLLIARDVTARKVAHTQLTQAGRLASVGTLAAGVAHEINSPLSYVIANLDLMALEVGQLGGRSTPEGTGELLQMCTDAREGAERVRKIVRSLKIFARADEERRVTLDVRAVLEMSINIAFNEVRHRARLVKDYGPTPLVEADEGRLGQVFINLIVNAAQAIPEGRADKNEIRITTSTDATGRAVIAVRDTGGGIPPEILGRIFDPFFTTKPVGIGTGLGLSICHGIVGELGGEISVESTMEQGTTVRIVLPAASRGPSLEARVAPPTVAAGPRGRILVTDDDASVATVLVRLLRREHEVTAVSSAKEALARIAGGAEYDVILCDLMMPEMTGMEFHTELAKASPVLANRVVFLTGGAFTPAARAFLDGVSNVRIEKPFDGNNLRALIRRFVGVA